MRKLLFIIAICFLTTFFAKGQKFSTCGTAAKVSYETFGPVMPNGSVDRSVERHHSHGLFFEEEHNVTWIAFEIPQDTVLTFDIFPQKTGQDINFLLFKDTVDVNEAFCKQIEDHKLVPVRTNLATPDSTKPKCSTGLSTTASDSIIPEGYNSNYSKALRVKKGDRFYLAIDNSTETKGAFILNLHVKFKTGPVLSEDHTVRNMDAPDIKAPKLTKFGKTNLTILVTDSSGHRIRAQLDISGAAAGQITSADTSTYTYTLIPRITININCNAHGYMFNEVAFTSPDTAANVTLPIIMTPVREHENMILKDIKFQEGVSIFLPSSQNELANLLEFMKNNPDVKILIKGFVNDPGSDNSGAAKKLSKQRAQAVYSFLAAAGVDKKRMDFKGFGNEMMIYPHPVNDRQQEANRRVEVEVMK